MFSIASRSSKASLSNKQSAAATGGSKTIKSYQNGDDENKKDKMKAKSQKKGKAAAEALPRVKSIKPSKVDYADLFKAAQTPAHKRKETLPDYMKSDEYAVIDLFDSSVLDPESASISSVDISAIEEASVNSDASFEQLFGLSNEKDFEYSIPNTWDQNRAKEVVSNVLLSTETDEQVKARELFLLDQLRRPAPPITPPSIWSDPSINDKSLPNGDNTNAKSNMFDASASSSKPTGNAAATASNAARKFGSSPAPKTTVASRVFGSNKGKKGNTIETVPEKATLGRGYKVGNAKGNDLIRSLDPVSKRSQKAFKAKAKVRNRKSILPVYDPSELVKQEIEKRIFWNLTDLLRNPSVRFGWKLRIFMARDLVGLIKDMHDAGYVHNDIGINTILVDDAFRVELKDTGKVKHVSTLKQKKGATEADRKMRDMVGFGQSLLHISIPDCSENSFPKLKELIELEDGELSKKTFDDEKLIELNDAVEQEIRTSFSEHPDVPGSLQELAVQCCSGIRSNRPSALDAWDWLDSLAEDMKNSKIDASTSASQDEKNKPSDNPVELLIAINQDPKLKQAVIKKPQVVKNFGDNAKADDDDSDSQDSQDSYMPPQRTQSLSAGDARSKLSAFISTNAPSTTGGGASDDEFGDIKRKENVRRRSLDRGYMWARAKTGKNVANPTKSTQIAQSHLGRFKQAWQVAQTETQILDPDAVAEKFKAQIRITPEEASAIIKNAEAIMKKEPNMLTLKPPLIVVGDLHGQFFDLLNLFTVAGPVGSGPGQYSYLFLGDYVDRGPFSSEVILYLYSLKAKYPENVYLLRGNHECRTVSSYFGFKEECEVKYGLSVFNRAVMSFQSMPIAAVVETSAGRFLCCHGGISPNVTSLQQFNEINRFDEPGMNGFLCDVLWADPIQDSHDTGNDSFSLGDFLSIDYLPNPARGCSYRYGYKSLLSFLAVNKLVCIIRAHEVQMTGYRYHFQELTGGKGKVKANVTPPVITVFSAPNYCGRYGNQGAILKILPSPPNVVQTKGAKTPVGGAGFKPLELIIPVQFEDVSHPEPMQFESEQSKSQMQIEKTCPYMPTTFYTFIKRAIELAEIRRQEEEEADAELEAKETSVNIFTAAARVIGEKARTSLRMSLGPRKNGTQTDNKKKDETPAEKKANEKFFKAVANDGINEMNPEVVQQKLDAARSRLEHQQPEIDPSLIASPRVQSVKDISRQNLSIKFKKDFDISKVADSMGLTEASSKKEGNNGSKEILTNSNENGDGQAVTFTQKELVALQMLFLIIDRTDKGNITIDDLIAWSQEDGAAVQREEAEMCMEAMDEDGDGSIGFSDYLAFAARSKNRWLLTEFANVLHHVKQSRERAHSG